MFISGGRKLIVASPYATWDPANKAATVTLSGGNLTADCGTVAGSVRGTLSKSAGKWYWEAKFSTLTSGPRIGVCKAGFSTSSAPGSDANSYGWAAGGGVFFNGSNISGLAGYTTSDQLAIGLDMVTNTVFFYKNNILQGSTVIGAGTWFPLLGQAGTAANASTANFGASAFVYTPPAGFNAGLY